METPPEVLSMIFSLLSPEDLASCARVCRRWSETALDELWREIDDVHQLLCFVVKSDPFFDSEEQMNQEGPYGLSDGDWLKFNRYAARVRTLRFRELAIVPSDEDLARLCLRHPFGTSFTPNIRRIDWEITHSESTFIMPFISESLQEMRIGIKGIQQFDGDRTFSNLFLRLAHRTPRLTKLHIEDNDASATSPDAFVHPLSTWVQTCPKLEEIHIPRHWHTSDVVAVFQSLAHLIEFGFNWTDPATYVLEFGVQAVAEEGQFPSLRRLGWTSEIGQAEDLLKRSSKRGFQGLTFDCSDDLGQEEVMRFLDTIAKTCSSLRQLTLCLDDIMLEDVRLTLKVFRPLLACRALNELRVHSPYPFILSLSDIEGMGAAWPDMQELALCPDPEMALDGGSGIPITSLSTFAASFPRLQVLGLFIDKEEPPGSAGDLLPEIQFRWLRELDVGLSWVPQNDSLRVGFYLASLFSASPRPSIKAGRSEAHLRSTFDLDDWTGYEWEEVERIVHLTLDTKEAVVRKLEGLQQAWRDTRHSGQSLTKTS
ncbi:hypothetical protein FRB90_012572 [Tulasnella sp. 427]|nr:hypothetical protein FRB90_012572 [Tulasnella sp. 427]